MATAGYTTQGASTYNAGSASGTNNPAGLLITLTDSALVSKITAYVNGTVATKNTTCKIFDGSAGSKGSLVATSDSTAVTTTPGWVDFPFTGTVLLSATTYWLEFTGYGGDGPGTNVDQIAFDTGGPSNSSYTLNDFGTPTYSTSQFSIYATYTVYVPPTNTSGFFLPI